MEKIYKTMRNTGAACVAVGIVVASVGLAAVSAVVYGVLSFLEKEKNYILAKISLGISGTLLFLWLAVFFIS